MKNRHVALALVMVALAVLLACMVGPGSAVGLSQNAGPLAPLGSGFTYQGELMDDAGNPITTSCDFQFTLWTNELGPEQVGGVSTASGVPVDEGTFSAPVNEAGEFGPGAFDGELRYLEVAVRCPAGGGEYDTLAPRQALTAQPNAHYARAAGSAPWSGLSGVPAGFADGLDGDTTYTSGTGLTLVGTEFALATAYRLPQGCASGQSPEMASTGGWSCGNDADTTYTSGTGLTLSGYEFALATAYRLPQGCASGQTPKISPTGGWSCGNDANTTYTAGEGLALNVSAFSAAWGGSGLATTVARSDHHHLGQTWLGTTAAPLTIDGTFGSPGYAPLVLGNTAAGGDGLRVSASDDGVQVASSGRYGLFVDAAAQDGVHIYRSGSPTRSSGSSSANGFEVEGAQGYGLYIGQADLDGVHVYQAGSISPASNSSAANGFEVNGAEGNGLYVGRAGLHGVDVDSAVGDGVHIYRVGGPTGSRLSPSANGLEVAGAAGNGLYVGWADLDGVVVSNTLGSGVYVNSAAEVGVHVYRAGNPTATYDSSSPNGVEVEGAAGHGVWIGQADEHGMIVRYAGRFGVEVEHSFWDGFYVYDTSSDGFHVASADDDGLEVESAGNRGVNVISAAQDGVRVYRAGSPTDSSSSSLANGFEVEGAQGYGLRIGRSDAAGVFVSSAGGSGLYVSSTAVDGLYVDSATDDGVQVASAGDMGVYANTAQATHEWGVYTPDKIYAGTALASGGPTMIVAQSGEDGELEPGDVVAVSGVGAPFAGSEFPVPQVQKAGAGAVAGVVYRRFTAEEEAQQVEGDRETAHHTTLRTRSTEGAIARGDYLLIVVLGPAQVKADGVHGQIRPGDLLAATGGAATRLGLDLAYVPGSIVGTAMEPLGAMPGSGLIWVLVMPR